jgi:hypothetical protein
MNYNQCEPGFYKRKLVAAGQVLGALDLTTTTSTRFDRVRGNYRSRFRFHSNVAFLTVNQQREKKFHKLNLLQTKIPYKTCK